MLIVNDNVRLTPLGRMYFRFDDGSNRIEVFVNGLTGRECVQLNGIEISARRSLRLTSRHHFRAERTGDEYVIELTADWNAVRVSCALSRRGNPVGVHLITNRFSSRIFYFSSIVAAVTVIIFAEQMGIRPIYSIAAFAVLVGALFMSGFRSEYRVGALSAGGYEADALR